MKVHFFIKMWCVLALCPVLLAVGTQTLSIDSQLGTSVEDCFERVSIGEQLPPNAIYRNVSELTTRECEQICKQDKQCQAYDYGVGAKGNATCDLSTISEKDIKERSTLLRHPDYDVYVRRFQCEQAPPSPLQPLQDEIPGDGPTHRPVFRPDAEDAKRPLADDFAPDLRPYEPTRPDVRPYPPYMPYKPSYSNHIDRPDDYANQRPAYDAPPSYGAHTPQDIPFRPERPFSNYSDPYDVLQFEGPRPQPSWRPDSHYPSRPNDGAFGPYGQTPHRPNLPPYTSEKPEFVYINRPNRRPSRPHDDIGAPGYGNKPSDYPKPDAYGPNYSRPYKPSRPMDYPYRPHDTPEYDYNSQYASNYGQNQYNDNSIYLEIFDPPRPYKPRPMNDKPTYGSSGGYSQGYGYGGQSFGSYGGSYSNQNTHTQNSQTNYGGSSITQLDNYNRPSDSGHRPYKPQDSPGSGYGLQDTHKPEKPYDRPISGYGISQPQDPSYKPQKPAYGSSSSGYGSSQSSQSSYGSSQSSHLDPSYGSQSGYGSHINQKPQNYKPSYNEKPSYGGLGSYGTQGSYGSTPGDHTSQGYGVSQSAYGSQQSFQDYHTSHQTSYGSSNQYGGYQDSYVSHKPINDKPSYGDNRPEYDEGPSYNKPSNDRPSYGSKPSYNDKPSYDNRPSYNDKPLYDDGSLYGERPSYNKPGYGNEPYGNKPGLERPSYDNRPYVKPSYDNRPSYEQPSYGQTPSYDKPSSSYGQTPSYDNKPYEKPSSSYGQSPSYDNKPYEKPSSSYGQSPSYDNKPYEKPSSSYGQSPSYDNKPYEKPSSSYGQTPSYDSKPYEKPSHSQTPSYGQTPSYDKPSYGQTPSYDNNRPDGELGTESDLDGYKNSGNNQTGYLDKPDVKPVYEYESEKPSNVPSYIVRPGGEVITSRPVTVGDYGGRPAYGREPLTSYKACFRRVLAGKRALRSFVKKVVPCERLEDCRRECAEQKRFHCESFNYRLDPSFRGKGLCEMMTKPIEAFDIRRDFVEDKDYDFYELDRNSLEPHCPETLRGPGLLHSGFLSSKPHMESYQTGLSGGSGWDRNDWYDRGDRNRFDDRRFGGSYGGGRRRYEDPFFVPYQIGLARSNDEESCCQYGGYGRSYYKDRNDYHKSINHWGLNDLEPPLYGVRPLGNQNFNYNNLGKKVDRYGYGAWKRGRFGSTSSGSKNGLDYGESSYLKPPKPVFYESGESEERSEEVLVKDCSSRRSPGMSLGSGAIRRSLHARTVVQCEAACFNELEFKCVSYSYRYSHSHGSDNCYLSERPYRGLELSHDSGSDVYAMPEDHGCSAVSTKPFVESECFWHVRSGAAVSGSAIRAALTVAGLGACEAECIRAHSFFCRGFSFRFDSPTIGDDLENCILTSTPPTSLDTGRGLRPNAAHELYARGNYGRGCEPALYDDVQHRDSGECYLQYDNAAKLVGTAVKGSAKVRDEQSCGKACTDAPFRCLSFSYNNNAPPNSDNCLLSEIRLFDLQRGVDYEHSIDDWLFAFDLFNGQCWRKVHGKEDYDQPAPELPRPLSPPPHSYPSSGPSGPSSSGHPGSSGPSGPSGPTGYLPAPVPAEPYLPASGPATGSGYKPYPEPRPDPGPGYPGPGYLPAEPPGYLPKPGYKEPSGHYRPSGPSEPRPSGLGYLPTGPPETNYGPNGPFRPPPPVDPYRPAAPPTGPFRPSGPIRPDRPGRPGYPDTGYGPPLPPGPPGEPGLPGPPSPPDRPREEPIAVSWRHYTVSGFPCRQGSSCAQNQVAGHWSCEPEGGEIGAWDYCCAPTHRCGYSEGFHKPWCYVGPSQDQWRPCSEKYYPYHQHNIPHPSQGHRGPGRPLPAGPPGLPGPSGPPGPRPMPGPYDRPDPSYLPEADRRYWDELYKNGPQAYYDKYGNPLPGYTRVPTAERPYIKYSHHYPRPGSGQWVPVQAQEQGLDPPIPGGLGVPRYWPVAYLHKESPPNTTYFKYNQTERPISSTTEKYEPRPPPPSRDSSRDPYPSRDFSRDDYPSRDRSRDPNRDFNRDQNRNFDREPPREFDRDQNRNFDRESSKDFDRDQNRNFDREPSRGIDRDNFRDFDREPSRGFDRDNSRDFDREKARDGDRDDSRDLPREPNKDYPGEPTRDRTPPRERPPPSFVKVNPDKPTNNNIDNKNHRDEKTRNITNADQDILTVDLDKVTTTTPKVEVKVDEDEKNNKTNTTRVETVETEEKVNMEKELDSLKGIDDKIDDFSKSIEVLDIEDAKKGEKLADLKTLEAEERQIEAIGRLLASRRGSKLVLEKRSQKDLESKSIALDKDLVDFNFGNKFPASNVERRGTVQRVTKEELARERLMDKSLEVSETTFVRPPRVLSTTENIRKAIVNGKVFYSASIRDQRDITNNTNTRKENHTNFRRDTNSTRKAKSLRPLEERAPSIINSANYGKKKVVRTRNVNPVRKVRRVYRRKYNPDEVRRRLLEREKNMKESDGRKL